MIINIEKFKTVEPDTSEISIGFGIIKKTFPLVCGTIEIPKNKLIVITGISGSGKTSCLKEVATKLNKSKITVNTAIFDSESTILKDFFSDINTLTFVGLGDIVTLLTPVKYLSDGQKYRLGLASLLQKQDDILIIDEFCNQLDELSTLGILRLTSKLAKDKLIVVATSRPYGCEYVDCIVYNIDNGIIKLRTINHKKLVDDITYRIGTKNDWPYFSQWHYRSGSAGLPTKILIFSYKEIDFGIVLAGLPYLSISCRNKIFPQYNHNGVLVNKDIFHIHRIVIRPEFRGLGLSKYMIDTVISHFPQKKIVELITSLNGFIPFMDKNNFVYGGDTLPDPVRKYLVKSKFDFNRYLDDDYVSNFVSLNRDKLISKCKASSNRGISDKRISSYTNDELVYNVKRMANVSTKYYYKLLERN